MPENAIKTDRQVAALLPKARPYESSVSAARGLAVRVFKSGEKAFEFRYVSRSGVRRRMTLGIYPGLSLADATRSALELRVAVIRGSDPAGERLAEREKARTGETVNDLSLAYFAAAKKGLHGGRGRPKSPSSLKSEQSRFDNHISPALGRKRFCELTRSEVKQFMRGLATQGALSADSINSVGRTLSSILAFAVHEERMENNPAAGLTRPLALKQRDRMFSRGSLARLWRALESNCPLSEFTLDRIETDKTRPQVRAQPVVSLALRFALITLTRRGDVAGATWDEIDFASKTWTIPAARHKSRRVHIVPLCSTALALLAEARQLTRSRTPSLADMQGWVFPSPKVDGAHIQENALTRAITRTCVALGLPHGSPHDFRRTGATMLTSEEGDVRRF